MKKAALLILLMVGCSSDDDLFLPDPPPDPPPAPGELPLQVTVTYFNLKDEVCDGASTLDRSGVLTHIWTNITAYDSSDDEIEVSGDLLSIWDNNGVGDPPYDCHSERVFPNATEKYPAGPLALDVLIITDPSYFQP